MHTEGDRRRR